MSISEGVFIDSGSQKLKTLVVRIKPIFHGHLALRTLLSAFHDFPFDADEHPDPSSHELRHFQPEDDEGALS